VTEAADVEELIRTMGLAFSNASLYGGAHKVTRRAVARCFSVLSRILERCEEVTFIVGGEDLLINDHQIDAKGHLNRAFLASLSNLEIDSFSLLRGVSPEQLGTLIEIMRTYTSPTRVPGAQGADFAAELAANGLEMVRVKKVKYRQVAEDEEVVSKDELGEEERLDSSAIEGILAFLKGDVSADDDSALRNLDSVASSADKLGELIMRAAEIRQQAADVAGGETLTDLVVGCLRRAGQAVNKSPAAKTQKGRKNLANTMLLLEKDVLDRLRELSGGVSAEEEQAISEAIDQVTEELKVGGMASEYMKKQKALDKAEKRVVRYVKRTGIENIEDTVLPERLAEEGMTPEGWQKLLVKSEKPGKRKGEQDQGLGPGLGEGLGGSAGLGADSRLVSLLATVVESIERDSGSASRETLDEIDGVVKEVHEEVDHLADETQRKITDLVETTQADAQSPEGDEELSKKKMVEVLAEVVQELCQPLTVITCSIDMARSGSLGEVTETQVNMLDLAASSAERLQQLITKLMQISDVPDTLTPDAEIVSSLYSQ